MPRVGQVGREAVGDPGDDGSGCSLLAWLLNSGRQGRGEAGGQQREEVEPRQTNLIIE